MKTIDHKKIIIDDEDVGSKTGFYVGVLLDLKKRFLKEVKQLFPRFADHLDIEEYGNHTEWTVHTSLKKTYTFEGEEIIKDSEYIRKISFLITVTYKGRLIERPIPVVYWPGKEKLEYDRSKLQTINRAYIMPDIEQSREYVNEITSQFKKPYFLPMSKKIGSITNEIEKAVIYFHKNLQIPKEEIRESLTNLTQTNKDLQTVEQIIRTELKERFKIREP